MCGILGLVGPDIADWAAAFNLALDLMAHRGPDGSGVWTSADGQVRLGHRRLAILDLSKRGAQPMICGGGGLVITFNGEIYNYLEVRAELQRLGHVFHSGTDTEVVLEAYRAWGPQALQRFNGMFAFALYDLRRRRLLCARDRFGEKPFLYHVRSGGFAFASEYKALLALPGVGRGLDELRLIRAAVHDGRGRDTETQTAFHAIRQLCPGEALTLDLADGALRVWRYWDLDPARPPEMRSEAEAFARFRELLTDAVRLRLRSDVAVGSCLSGGLDSGAILCLARRLLGPEVPYHAFTGRFPGTPADEWHYAGEVVAATGAISHVVEPTVDRFLDELPRFLWHAELPVGGSSQFAQWCVFDLAREQGVTVLLDGQGADEVLGGYESYFGPYLASLRALGDHRRLAQELPAIRTRYPVALTPTWRRWRDLAPLRLRHALANRLGRGGSTLFGLTPAVAAQIDRLAVVPGRSRLNPLAQALYRDSFQGFLPTLLRYGDRLSMAHSREVRLPFCDHRLAEFAFSLPPHFLMGGAQTKRLLREGMRGILPEAVRTRWNKQGFRPPQEDWFKSPRLLTLVRDTLASRAFLDSPYWHVPWWHKVLARVEGGETQLAWSLWQPFIIESWRQHFLGSLGTSGPRRVVVDR